MSDDIKISRENLRGLALSTIKAVLGSERYQYLSGPITGGIGLVKWHTECGRGQPKGAEFEPVVKPNLRAVVDEAARQRENGVRTIEPASFETYRTWRQDDYLALWDRVIELHACQVRFMNGWEYSAGCAYEYCRAIQYGVKTVDILGEPLDRSKAIELLDAALFSIASHFQPGDPADDRIEDLHRRIAVQRAAIAVAN